MTKAYTYKETDYIPLMNIGESRRFSIDFFKEANNMRSSLYTSLGLRISVVKEKNCRYFMVTRKEDRIKGIKKEIPIAQLVVKKNPLVSYLVDALILLQTVKDKLDDDRLKQRIQQFIVSVKYIDE